MLNVRDSLLITIPNHERQKLPVCEHIPNAAYTGSTTHHQTEWRFCVAIWFVGEIAGDPQARGKNVRVRSLEKAEYGVKAKIAAGLKLPIDDQLGNQLST